MTALFINVRGERWSLRQPGDVFPLLEGKPGEVVEYVQQHFTGRGVVELRQETGVVEQVRISALEAPALEA